MANVMEAKPQFPVQLYSVQAKDLNTKKERMWRIRSLHRRKGGVIGTS
jgi:hypothetical protein